MKSEPLRTVEPTERSTPLECFFRSVGGATLYFGSGAAARQIRLRLSPNSGGSTGSHSPERSRKARFPAERRANRRRRRHSGDMLPQPRTPSVSFLRWGATLYFGSGAAAGQMRLRFSPNLGGSTGSHSPKRKAERCKTPFSPFHPEPDR